MKKEIVITFFCLVVFCAFVRSAAASGSAELACLWETCVPKEKNLEGMSLSLRGLAPFRYFGFRVYTAALYLPDEVKDVGSSLGLVPLRLEIHYYREFAAKDFRESGEEVLGKNPEVSIEKFRAELDEINSFYRPVVVGDSYALTFLPDRGLTLLLNDLPLGTVRGNDFARAYLGIWLSRYSLSSSFTEELT